VPDARLSENEQTMTEAAPPAKRPRGRPPSAKTLVNRVAITQARAEGKLPHEILLDIARGTPLVQSRMEWHEASQTFKPASPAILIPDLQMRLAAARDAAPYFAPKLSALELLASMSDDELDELVAVAAAEAGVGLGAAGEGAARKEAPAGGGGDPSPADRPDSDIAGDA
jgi:hypothetical protein